MRISNTSSMSLMESAMFLNYNVRHKSVTSNSTGAQPRRPGHNNFLVVPLQQTNLLPYFLHGRGRSAKHIIEELWGGPHLSPSSAPQSGFTPRGVTSGNSHPFRDLGSASLGLEGVWKGWYVTNADRRSLAIIACTRVDWKDFPKERMLRP